MLSLKILGLKKGTIGFVCLKCTHTPVHKHTYVQGVLFLKLQGRKCSTLERRAVSSSSRVLSGHERWIHLLCFPCPQSSSPPPYSCDTVNLAFAKMLSLGKPVRGWYETERSYHTSALWLCTDVPCLSFLTVHYSFELPFLHSWSCLYVWRTFFPSFLNRLLFLRMLPFFCAASAHFIFFSFLLEYDIALKRINAIMWCIWQGYFQKGKCFSSTMIWKTEEASLKILWPIWVTSDQKKGKRHKEL